MLPSEYIARNARVTPFNNFERPDKYILAHRNVQDSFCYSSDYPHHEGGVRSAQKMFGLVSPLGPSVVAKFFRDNAKLLLPE
jgi:hypothetical protein